MTAEHIAQTFRHARLNAVALPAYPADAVPASLTAAYAIQDLAISEWPDRVAGWKVAAVQPQWRETYPVERLAGPIFARRVVMAADASTVIETPVISGAYAAVEAEFALLLGDDFPLDTYFNDAAELQPYVAAVHGAIEMAGSPLANLSALGPGAVISDFGNNTGLIVGPALADFFSRPLDAWTSETQLNGAVAGTGSAGRIPNGPLAALLFLANNLVSRGTTLRPGDWVSTGASTGIHPVKAGDTALVSFDGQLALSVRVVEAAPQAAA